MGCMHLAIYCFMPAQDRTLGVAIYTGGGWTPGLHGMHCNPDQVYNAVKRTCQGS